jgi:hypothetical protein
MSEVIKLDPRALFLGGPLFCLEASCGRGTEVTAALRFWILPRDLSLEGQLVSRPTEAGE